MSQTLFERASDIWRHWYPTHWKCSQPTKEDAENIKIPHICLASSGEREKVNQDAEVFSGQGHVGEVDTYDSMSHGWMGAKSDLSKEENLNEFERGYAICQGQRASLTIC